MEGPSSVSAELPIVAWVPHDLVAGYYDGEDTTPPSPPTSNTSEDSEASPPAAVGSARVYLGRVCREGVSVVETPPALVVDSEDSGCTDSPAPSLLSTDSSGSLPDLEYQTEDSGGEYDWEPAEAEGGQYLPHLPPVWAPVVGLDLRTSQSLAILMWQLLAQHGIERNPGETPGDSAHFPEDGEHGHFMISAWQLMDQSPPLSMRYPAILMLWVSWGSAPHSPPSSSTSE